MQVRGSRALLRPLDADAALAGIEGELMSIGAIGIRRSGNEVSADRLVVSSFRAPNYLVSNLKMTVDTAGMATNVCYEATAQVKYTWRFVIWLLVPILLVVAYSIVDTPLMLLVLPIGFALLQLSHRVFLPLWLEEFAFKAEQRGCSAGSSGGA
jgi:hypothetical protein